MTIAKRILVCILYVPAVLASILYWPIEYVRTGKIDAMNWLADRLARWAK